MLLSIIKKNTTYHTCHQFKNAKDAAAAGGIADAALRSSDGAAGDGELAVAVDAVAGVAIGRSAAGGLLYLAAGDGEVAVTVDAAAAALAFAVAALRGSDGGAVGDGFIMLP